MKHIYNITILLILFTLPGTLAQTSNTSTFIAGMVGAGKMSSSGNEQSNPTSFSFGGSFGIPLTKNLYLYTRTSYSSKSNFQSFYNSAYFSGNFQLSDEFTEVNSSFSQLILNGGLLYSFMLSDEFSIGINGGATFMVINQEAVLYTGQVISSVDNEAVWGAFTGLIVEKGWGEDDFTTFVEAQYNYAESDAIYHSQALSAMNFSIGIRYYLERR